MATPRVTALVLAAGASRRMLETKLLLPVNGRPMIHWCLLTISQTSVANTVIVAGKDYQSVYAYVSLLPQARSFDFIINTKYASGMASSIRVGMTAVAADSDAVLLMLADMPFIGEDVVCRMLQTFADRGTTGSIVVPTWQGQRGHPVMLGSDYFDELAQLQGDKGPRELLARCSSKVISIAVGNSAILIDLDTKEQWQTWKTWKNEKNC